MNNVYKLAILWSAWTPRVATRILRDLLTYQRLSKQTRTTLVVAADQELRAKVLELGFNYSEDFLNATEVRVYVAEGQVLPDDLAARMPDATSRETVYIQPEANLPPITVEKDPYASIKFYKDWHRIPETMPLNKTPPKGRTEPLMSPFI